MTHNHLTRQQWRKVIDILYLYRQRPKIHRSEVILITSILNRLNSKRFGVYKLQAEMRYGDRTLNWGKQCPK